jgi:hypothetical protein
MRPPSAPAAQCGGDPSLEAARAARCQQVVQGRSERFGRETCILGHLRDAERLVPPPGGEESAAVREQRLAFGRIRLAEAADQKLPEERMERK